MVDVPGEGTDVPQQVKDGVHAQTVVADTVKKDVRGILPEMPWLSGGFTEKTLADLNEVLNEGGKRFDDYFPV